MASIIEEVIPIKHIAPYYEIALATARQSPCVRRQYGAVIGYHYMGAGPIYVAAANERVTKACDGVCIRDREVAKHGQRTELGAEVHAEQAALIKRQIPEDNHIGYFVIAGYAKGVELKGKDLYPCLVCARMVKYAGYKWVYLNNTVGMIEPVSINDIIEFREGQLSNDA